MWTIIVNNSGCTTSGNTITCSDLGGEKVTDALQTDGVDIQGDVVITGSDGSKRTVSAQEFMSNGYTFPEGSTAKTYTIAYQTNVPQSEAGHKAQVENRATINKPGEGTAKRPPARSMSRSAIGASPSRMTAAKRTVRMARPIPAGMPT